MTEHMHVLGSKFSECPACQELMKQMTEHVTITDRQRRILPQRRYCETFELVHGKLNTVFSVTLGRYPDSSVGEVFISGAKAGSELNAIARDGAVLLSIAMQYGVPLDVIRHAITREENGAPSTVIGAVIDRLVNRET